MKNTTRGIIGAAVLFIASLTQAQIETGGLQLVQPDQVPKSGTFWLAKGPNGQLLPPLPFPPNNLDVPIYALTNGQFLVDNSDDMDYATPNQAAPRAQAASMAAMDVPLPGGRGQPRQPAVASPQHPERSKVHGADLLRD
jgi:hypothetical protein